MDTLAVFMARFLPTPPTAQSGTAVELDLDELRRRGAGHEWVDDDGALCNVYESDQAGGAALYVYQVGLRRDPLELQEAGTATPSSILRSGIDAIVGGFDWSPGESGTKWGAAPARRWLNRAPWYRVRSIRERHLEGIALAKARGGLHG